MPNVTTLERCLPPTTLRGDGSTKAPTSPGTLGMFNKYGVGNPPDLVSGRTPSLVNR